MTGILDRALPDLDPEFAERAIKLSRGQEVLDMGQYGTTTVSVTLEMACQALRKG